MGGRSFVDPPVNAEFEASIMMVELRTISGESFYPLVAVQNRTVVGANVVPRWSSKVHCAVRPAVDCAFAGMTDRNNAKEINHRFKNPLDAPIGSPIDCAATCDPVR
jgi:hypothetical protein